MKKRYFLRLCVIFLAIGLVLAGCDIGSLLNNDDPDQSAESLILTGTSDGKTLTIIIRQSSSSRAAYAPKSGDSYEIRLANELISMGKISVDGSNWTFMPSSNSPNQSTVSVTYNNGTISNLTVPGAGISNAQVSTSDNDNPSGGNNNGTNDDDDEDDNRIALTGTVTINTTSPKVGDTLTATYSGNGTGNASWQWLRNNTSIDNANSRSYTVTSADEGATLRARVSYVNQKGSVTSVPTAAVEEQVFPETVSVPTASLAGGIYSSTQSVTLGTTTSDAAIYYTINGSEPTTSSTQYTNAISITRTTTLKAIAVKAGMNKSPVLTANYYFYSGSDLPLGNSMSIRDANTDGGVVVELKGNPKQITNYYTTTQVAQITQKLYTVFDDDFDSIILVMDNDGSYAEEIGYLYGINYRVSNAVEGIGINQFSDSARWGSGGKLKSVMAFPYREGIAYGPGLHEFAHNWAAYICPTFTVNPPNFISDYPYDGHWGMSNAGGQLGGFKYVRTVETNVGGVAGKTKYQGSMREDINGDGSFLYPGFGDNANGGNGLPYSDIELYLMGMKSADELRAKNFTLEIYTGLSFDESDGPGYFYATGKKTYTIDDLIALNGGVERSPNDSQKNFKVLTVFVSANNSPDENYQTVVGDLKWFANMEGYKNKYQGLYNFNQATESKGNLVVTGLKDSLK